MRNLRLIEIIKTSLRWFRKSWYLDPDRLLPASPIIRERAEDWGGKGKRTKMLIRLPSGWSRMARSGEVEEGIPLKGVAKHHKQKIQICKWQLSRNWCFLIRICLLLSYSTLNIEVRVEYIIQLQSHTLYHLQVEEHKYRLNWALGSCK